MSNVRFLHIRQRDADLLDPIPAETQRAIATEFLCSDESMGRLLERCTAPGEEGRSSRTTLACVLLMVRNDAPQDLVMVDPQLYRRLRERITDLRVGGWIAPYQPGIDG